jgi:hypothetical protein
LRYEEVEEGREGAALPHAGVRRVDTGFHAVGVDTGGRLVEEKASPVDHPVRRAHGQHDTVEEIAVNCVKRFGDVDGDDGAGDVVGKENMGEESSGEDGVTYQAARKVSSLVQADGGGHGDAKALGQHAAEDPILGREEGYGAERGDGGRGGGSRLGKGADSTPVEAVGEATKCAGSGEKTGEEGDPSVVVHPPQGVGDAV